MGHDHAFNRAAFLAGSLAAGIGLAGRADASPSGAEVDPDQALALLKDGNRRFVANQFPTSNKIAEKRELLQESQAPIAAILSCADSRVIPELIFIQGLGQLFVTRVAGNYPDDLVTGSLEYAVEHLGARLVMVLGHQNCGAVKAVYDAIEDKKPLGPHLAAIQSAIGPGIGRVVREDGSMMAAVEANVRAAVATLRAAPPVLAEAVSSKRIRVVGAVYLLGTGKVRLLD